MREQLVRKVDIIPVEVVVRNVSAGQFSQRFKMDEGIFSFYYVIAEAIRNFLIYTPFKFMLFALLVIEALIYFFAF